MTNFANTKEAMAAARTRMEKAVEDFRKDIAAIRTGRANASLLDHVRVDYHGTPMPVKQVADCLDNRLRVWHDGSFERRAVRSRRMQTIQALDRRIEVVKAFVHDLGRDFAANAARLICLVYDQEPARFVDRLKDRVDVQR